MTAPQKFMFETHFEDNVEVLDPIEELKAQFTQRIEKAEAESFEAGRIKGKQEASETIAQQTKDILEKISQSEQKLRKEFKSEQQKLEAEAIEFGITAGIKLAGDLLKQQPLPIVENFFKEAFAIIQHTPIITAKIHPAMTEAVTSQYQNWAHEAGFDCTINFIEDATLDITDVVLTWSDGGIKRSVDEIISAIQQTLETYGNSTSTQANEITELEAESLEELTIASAPSTATIEKASVNHE